MRHQDRVKRDVRLQALMRRGQALTLRNKLIAATRQVPHAFMPAFEEFIEERLGLRG